MENNEMIQVLVIMGKNETVDSVKVMSFEDKANAELYCDMINVHSTDKYYQCASIIQSDVEYEVYGSAYGAGAYILKK